MVTSLKTIPLAASILLLGVTAPLSAFAQSTDDAMTTSASASVSMQASEMSSSAAVESSAADTVAPQPSGQPLLQMTIGGQAVTFWDIPAYSWFTSAVQALIQRGIASGYTDTSGRPLGLFKPNDPLTSAEAVKMILSMTRQKLSDGQPENVSARNTWAAPFIKTVEDMDITTIPAGLNVFIPASRGAVIQTIFEITGIPFDPVPNSYIDLPDDSPYAKAILTATRLHLIKGDDKSKTVRPDAFINRAEMAKILSILLPTSRVSPAALTGAVVVQPLNAAQYRYKIVSTVKVHSLPQMDSRVPDQLSAGTPVQAISTIADTWVEIEYGDGKQGYVGFKYVSPTPTDLSSSATTKPPSAPQPDIPAPHEPPMSSSVSSSEPTGSYITAPVKIRVSPDIASAVLTQLSAGTPVTVLEAVGQWWLHISFSGREGYVVPKYVHIGVGSASSSTASSASSSSAQSSVSVGYAATILSTVKVHSLPDPASRVPDQLKTGTPVQIIGVDGGWMKIQYGDGKQGYVWFKYVQQMQQ